MQQDEAAAGSLLNMQGGAPKHAARAAAPGDPRAAHVPIFARVVVPCLPPAVAHALENQLHLRVAGVGQLAGWQAGAERLQEAGARGGWRGGNVALAGTVSSSHSRAGPLPLTWATSVRNQSQSKGPQMHCTVFYEAVRMHAELARRKWGPHKYTPSQRVGSASLRVSWTSCLEWSDQRVGAGVTRPQKGGCFGRY
jgi:hypothetical protein